MKRTAVQITTASIKNVGMAPTWVTTVLCDDGTMWFMEGAGVGWRKLAPIPQDKEKAEL